MTTVNPGYIIDNPETAEPLFKIQPNPTGGQFTLELLNPDQRSPILVEIYDIMGERLKRMETEGQSVYEFDLSDYPSGIYIVKVSQEDGFGVMKVIRR